MNDRNTLKTRIILTHDKEENWNKRPDFIPKAGEVIVYDIDETHDTPRFKIGTGNSIVSDLPFATDNTLKDIFIYENDLIIADGGEIA